MAKIGVSEGGHPQTGKIYSFADLDQANTSPDIFREDPVFGCVEHLRDFYAKSDLMLYAKRFCTRIVTFEDLWAELQRRAVPGRFGETQRSRNGNMTEEVKSGAEATEAKPKKERKKREPKAPKEPKEKKTLPVDQFGLREGSKASEIAAFLAEGHTMAEVNEKFGSTHYNLVKRLGDMGHEVVKDGAKITIIANPNYHKAGKGDDAPAAEEAAGE